MTVDEISKLAASESPIDRTASCAERCLYYELRELYRLFRTGVIKKEKGEEKKKDAIKRYNQELNETERREAAVFNMAKLWKNIELAGHRYAAERTVEAADAFFEAVYGVKLKYGPLAEQPAEQQDAGPSE